MAKNVYRSPGKRAALDSAGDRSMKRTREEPWEQREGAAAAPARIPKEDSIPCCYMPEVAPPVTEPGVGGTRLEMIAIHSKVGVPSASLSVVVAPMDTEVSRLPQMFFVQTKLTRPVVFAQKWVSGTTLKFYLYPPGKRNAGGALLGPPRGHKYATPCFRARSL